MRRWLRENAYTGLRALLGAILFIRGIPLAVGGFATWNEFGGKLLSAVGIESFHTATGFFLAYCLCLGGLGLVTGFLFYPAVLLSFLASGAFLARVLYIDFELWRAGEVVPDNWQALALFVMLLIYLAISGPGGLAVDNLIVQRRRWRLTLSEIPPKEAGDGEDAGDGEGGDGDDPLAAPTAATRRSSELERETKLTGQRKRSGTKETKPRKRKGTK